VTLRALLSAVDFSEQSRHALRWAGLFATRFQSRLTVLSVVEPLLAEAARTRFGQDLKTETEPALRKFVAATWPGGTVWETKFKTAVGEPATVIAETATGDAAELIVMGTQGLGGLRKWLLGSTTERLLRRAQVPVLAVPLANGESDASGVDDQVEIQQILAAADFSESSEAAIKYAVQLATAFSATLTMAHAVEPLTVPPPWRPLVQESDETRVADACTRLKALAERVCGRQVCEGVVSIGRPGDVIASIAQERRAQPVVMGLTGEQGRFAPRPGTIAYRVLISATVPVLVVPGSDK
jgi:nucleotide-binding universal stress UspA family protein